VRPLVSGRGPETASRSGSAAGPVLVVLLEPHLVHVRMRMWRRALVGVGVLVRNVLVFVLLVRVRVRLVPVLVRVGVRGVVAVSAHVGCPLA